MFHFCFVLGPYILKQSQEKLIITQKLTAFKRVDNNVLVFPESVFCVCSVAK